MTHYSKWTKMVPMMWREGLVGVRSMLWVNKELEVEQVPVPSPDVVATMV